MDKIFINDLAVFGYHGTLPEENVLGQVYRVSLILELDTRKAASADDLEQTVDYRRAIAIVKTVLTGPPQKLIETIADSIALRLLSELPLIAAVTVRLEKPHPPVGMELGSVAIEIRRQRENG